ncbi:E3 SUMO-protein ligase ZBED1-like [Macrosteles quadrilineatus]|uniref:E3 SUMO-protein ligase ZBED1-like n=1 Tax=Macrosteles quadrilineatus TaxID=74068 RepID=UPI0023E2F629|nr:E3 SUMO-protein ligase ZBED1-like [Macrosteles quadrilineatus]
MADLVAKARKIVGHYKHSSTASERLHQIQEEMGKEVLNLIQDVETRWNSEYLMLNRLIKNKEPVSRDLVSFGKIDNLTVSEWRLAEAYVKILEPLYEATVEMCSSIMPTASLVIPILYCIQEKLSAIINDEEGVGKMFSRQLLKSLRSRFPNSLKVDPYVTAMLTDPRFKDVALEPFERAISLGSLKQRIMTAIGQSPSETNQSKAQDEEDKSKSLWSIFKKAAAQKASEPQESTQLEIQVDNEFKIYFAEQTIPPSEDPCAWWRENEGRFPLLKSIVRQYLGIPATEVASERTFSSAGNVVSPLRQRLSNEHVEELVFLHQNAKLLYDKLK